MVQTKRVAMAAAATAAGNDTESGYGGSHTAGTGISSTQGYKPKPLLFNHTIMVMIFDTWFGSNLEYAYAKVIMLVSIISFLWIKVCCV